MKDMPINIDEFIKNSPGVVYWKDLQGIYQGGNQNMLEIAGLTQMNHLIGKTDHNLPWHESASIIHQNDQEIINSDVEKIFKEIWKIANGKHITYLANKKALRNNTGEIIGIIGIHTDISFFQHEINAQENQEQQQQLDFLAHFSKEVMGTSINHRTLSIEEYVKNLKNFLENIIAVMPGNVYWMDKNCVYLGCNNNSAQLMRLTSRTHVVGKSYDELAQSAHWNQQQGEKFKQDDLEVIRTGISKLNVEEPPVPGLNGELIYYLTSRTPLHDESGAVIGVVGVSIDITDRKKVEQELLAAKERAEAANKSKSEFFAAINHELRTPLTGMLGMARLLASEPLAPEHSNQVADMISAGEHLLSLVNDLLDMAKLEAGKLELNPAPVDLRKLIEEVATMLATQAKIKNLEMRVNYEEGTPHLIIADGKAIRQILLNLVGNALKFTHEGHIELKVELLQQNATEVTFKISVSDTGIGIPADQLENVFERFNQVDNSRTRKYGGTGLGLTINKAFIELMGGKIQVASEIDKGSIFSFDLIFPLQTEKTITSTWEPYRSNVRILIADDSLIGEVIKKHIGSSLCEIVPGAEIINYLLAAQQREQPFHIVMIDQQLKTSDPIALAKKINNQNNFEHPMLMYLMKPCPITEKNAAKAEGFFECLIKPLHPTGLLTSLTAAWEKWQDRLKPQKAITSLHTEKLFKVLLVEDDPIIQKVHSMMLKKIGCIVDIANSGIEALAMFKNGYDAIFMDIGLGEMSGLDVTTEIRRRENSSHLPIIAMTGYGDDESKTSCLAAGMNDVAVKPTTPETLKQLLEQWVVKAA